MVGSAHSVTGLRVSLQLDRRSFLTGVGLALGGVTIAATVAWPMGDAAAPVVEPSIDWAVDHIFGTYPPYAHPIPYGRQSPAPPVSIDIGAFDPILMI
jgi:hypothetical protein